MPERPQGEGPRRNEIEAILWHGYTKESDGYQATLKFYHLPKEDRDALVKFLRAI